MFMDLKSNWRESANHAQTDSKGVNSRFNRNVCFRIPIFIKTAHRGENGVVRASVKRGNHPRGGFDMNEPVNEHKPGRELFTCVSCGKQIWLDKQIKETAYTSGKCLSCQQKGEDG